MKRNNFTSIFIKIICFLILLSLVFSFCACGLKTDEDKEGVSFTDALGRDVTVESHDRVACLLGSFADIWMLSGGTVCATSYDAWEDFELDLGDAINLGGAHTPSLELLISASPTLVIASASTASNVEMLSALEAMNITVAYFDVNSFDDYLNMLNICTDITGRKDLYLSNGLNIKEQIDNIKSLYSKGEGDKILLLRASSTFVKAKGSEGTVLGEMLNDLGCENIADKNSSLLENLSVEAVILENPQHIFVVTMGSDTDKAILSVENMIKENPAWSTLDAVKNDNLHIMDKRLFNMKPNLRWAEAYQILYEIFTEE